MRITLTNEFHHSHVTLNANVLSHIHNVATAYLTVGQIKKAKRELCGVAGCTCGDEAGVRGIQRLDDGTKLVINYDAIYASN